MTSPLFRDERAANSPEFEAKIARMEKDFSQEVKDLRASMVALASLAGVQNTKLLVNSLLDNVESLADIQQ
jgi:DNA-binding ferritin-like protein (Dps family)